MSILLNALNKAKQSDLESDDIEQLIETPLDEQEVSEPEAASNRMGFQHGLLILLAIIALLLFAILWVLLSDQSTRVSSSAEEVVTNRTPVAASSTQPTESASGDQQIVAQTPAASAAINKSNTPAVNAQAFNSQGGNPLGTGTQGESSVQYLEKYQPKRDSLRDRTSDALPVTQVKRPQTATPPSSARTSAESQSLNTELPLKTINELTQVERMMVDEVTVDAHVYSEDASQRFIFVNGDLKQEGDKLVNSWLLEAIEEDGIIVNNGVLRVKLEQN